MTHLNQNVFLIGFMGVGKTTLARRLARNLNVTAIDVDTYVRRHYGVDARRLFQMSGEAALRSAESEALRACAAMGPAVISYGEGIPVSYENRSFLQSEGFTILLVSSLSRSLERVHSLRTRPLLAAGYDTEQLWYERMPLYEQCAHAVVDVSCLSTSAAAYTIEQQLIAHGVWNTST